MVEKDQHEHTDGSVHCYGDGTSPEVHTHNHGIEDPPVLTPEREDPGSKLSFTVLVYRQHRPSCRFRISTFPTY